MTKQQIESPDEVRMKYLDGKMQTVGLSQEEKEELFFLVARVNKARRETGGRV